MGENSFEVEDSTPLLPEQQTDEFLLLEQEPGRRHAFTRRKRLIQISLVLLALVVAAVTLQRALLPSSSPEAADQQSVPPAWVLVLSNLTFGTVTINGHQAGTFPLLVRAQQPTAHLSIDAPPFRPKTCTFAFAEGALHPPRSSDCLSFPISGAFSPITANGITATPSSAIEIAFTAADLPPEQHHQISTLLAHSIAVQQTTTVPAGSYLATHLNADGTITSQRASTRLQATASLEASTHLGTLHVLCTGLICPIATLPQQVTALTGKAWLIGVPAALRWRFTTAAGQVVGAVTFPAVVPMMKLLAYSSEAGWSLALPFSDPSSSNYTLGNVNCVTGSQVEAQQLPDAPGSASGLEGQGIEGCTMTLQDADGTAQGSFLWRFGVLLAVDAAAHHLLPTLPMAPPAEIAAVQG